MLASPVQMGRAGTTNSPSNPAPNISMGVIRGGHRIVHRGSSLRVVERILAIVVGDGPCDRNYRQTTKLSPWGFEGCMQG